MIPLLSPEITIVTNNQADTKLTEAERILNYTFKDKALGIEALLIARNVPFNTLVKLQSHDKVFHIETNAALAKIGDKALDLVLLRLFEPTGMWKGVFDFSIRQKLAANCYLSIIGTKLSLNECAIKHPLDAELGYKAVADVVEALIGAIALESGICDAEKAILTMGIVTKDMIVEESLCNTGKTRIKDANYFKNMISYQEKQLAILIGDFRARRLATG